MDTFRREIYMAALAELRRRPLCLCSALCKSIPGADGSPDDFIEEITPILPDWYSLAPERQWNRSGRLFSNCVPYGYWWDPDWCEPRIRFLEQLLSDTHGTF